jgi:hypothetical protein
MSSVICCSCSMRMKLAVFFCVHDVTTLNCRYGFLLPRSLSSQHDTLSVCVAILHQFGIHAEMYQVGITKLFFRAGQVSFRLLFTLPVSITLVVCYVHWKWIASYHFSSGQFQY